METINLTEKIGRLEFINREKIIKMLKNLPQDKLINHETLKEYSKQGLICHRDTIRKRFGSIKNACKEAGVRCDCRYTKEVLESLKKDKDFENKRRQATIKWNKENIIEALKKLEKKYGKIKAIDIPMYSKRGDICCADTIREHFKTIIDAFEQAGIKHRKYHWSKDRIIQALRALYDKHGSFAKKDLRYKFIKEGSICERVHIQKQFGSLDEAANQAGIEFRQVPNDGTRIGKYEIRENKIKSELGCNFERIKLY